jgi:hypothetical protein
MRTDIHPGPTYRPLLWLGIFAVAMGVLEAIVVVYLRELFYPMGFSFPLNPIPPRILYTEILREACTIVMLLSVAAVISRDIHLRLSYFLFAFGVWDIFYYLGLKQILGWPPSLLTWDILFLIPVTWTGPVLAPVISSITFIVLSLLMIYLLRRYRRLKAGLTGWGLIVLGAFAIFLTYIWDISRLILDGGFLSDLSGVAENAEFQEAVSDYVPERYNWGLFALGETLIISAMALMARRTRKASRG